MTSNGRIHKHRAATIWHFLLDFLIVCFAFVLGTRFRFDAGVPGRPGADWLFQLSLYAPGILAGAIALPIFLYIGGLYSHRLSGQRSNLRVYVLLGALFLAATVIMLAVFYVNFSTRVGRGVMVISWPTALLLVYAHHAWILKSHGGQSERVAFLVNDTDDSSELALFSNLEKPPFTTIGVIAKNKDGAIELCGLPWLGGIDDVGAIAEKHRIDRLVCSSACLKDSRLRSDLCQLRYSGVVVSSYLSLCEEDFHLVPLEFVSADWLLNASDSPRLMYIRKIKRGFDIAASIFWMAVLWPFLLAGIVLVKLTSKGPAFYRQTRAGRFGVPFKVIKLRTMRVDAESAGPQWSKQRDSRLTPVGHFLRKYRIDEIPQLLNVFRGQMSFVGPRPERPEFVGRLQETVPWYVERLLIHPGLTGWAQVNYPYGSSIEDAARKQEYDLYYMKHMGLYLDVAILMDTVRTILTGGAHHRPATDPLKRDFARYGGVTPVQPPVRPHDGIVTSRL